MGKLPNGNPSGRQADINSLNALLNMTAKSRSSFEDDLNTLANGIRFFDEDSPILSEFKNKIRRSLNADYSFECYKNASDDISATIKRLEEEADADEE